MRHSENLYFALDQCGYAYKNKMVQDMRNTGATLLEAQKRGQGCRESLYAFLWPFRQPNSNKSIRLKIVKKNFFEKAQTKLTKPG